MTTKEPVIRWSTARAAVGVAAVAAVASSLRWLPHERLPGQPTRGGFHS